jgi:hypothetical protein
LLYRIVANTWLHESLGKSVSKTLMVVVGQDGALPCLTQSLSRSGCAPTYRHEGAFLSIVCVRRPASEVGSGKYVVIPRQR